MCCVCFVYLCVLCVCDVCGCGRSSGYVMKPALHPFWRQEETCVCVNAGVHLCMHACTCVCGGLCVRTWLACAMC